MISNTQLFLKTARKMNDRSHRTPATPQESAALYKLDNKTLFAPEEYKTKVPNFVNLGIRKVAVNKDFDHYYSPSFIGQRRDEVVFY